MIALGNNKIKSLYLGNTQVKVAYLGNVKIYPSEVYTWTINSDYPGDVYIKTPDDTDFVKVGHTETVADYSHRFEYTTFNDYESITVKIEHSAFVGRCFVTIEGESSYTIPYTTYVFEYSNILKSYVHTIEYEQADPVTSSSKIINIKCKENETITNAIVRINSFSKDSWYDISDGNISFEANTKTTGESSDTPSRSTQFIFEGYDSSTGRKSEPLTVTFTQEGIKLYTYRISSNCEGGTVLAGTSATTSTSRGTITNKYCTFYDLNESLYVKIQGGLPTDTVETTSKEVTVYGDDDTSETTESSEVITFNIAHDEDGKVHVSTYVEDLVLTSYYYINAVSYKDVSTYKITKTRKTYYKGTQDTVTTTTYLNMDYGLAYGSKSGDVVVRFNYNKKTNTVEKDPVYDYNTPYYEDWGEETKEIQSTNREIADITFTSDTDVIRIVKTEIGSDDTLGYRILFRFMRKLEYFDLKTRPKEKIPFEITTEDNQNLNLYVEQDCYNFKTTFSLYNTASSANQYGKNASCILRSFGQDDFINYLGVTVSEKDDSVITDVSIEQYNRADESFDNGYEICRKVTLTFTPNPTTANRTSVVTFKQNGSGKTLKLTFTQAGASFYLEVRTSGNYSYLPPVKAIVVKNEITDIDEKTFSSFSPKNLTTHPSITRTYCASFVIFNDTKNLIFSSTNENVRGTGYIYYKKRTNSEDWSYCKIIGKKFSTLASSNTIAI